MENEAIAQKDYLDFERATDEAIAVCGGDARATVTALLIANAYLEDELAGAVPAISYGFARGRYARWGRTNGDLGSEENAGRSKA